MKAFSAGRPVFDKPGKRRPRYLQGHRGRDKKIQLQGGDILGLGAFLPLGHVELHLLAFRQRLKT